MKKGLSQETIKRVEAIEGMNIRDAVELRYFRELRSVRFLCKLWSVNGRTVPKLIRYCGFEPRHGGEAVATQWVGNGERRKAAGESLAAMNHRLALEGRHVRQGKTKENSELIRGISEKLKHTSSFLSPDVKARALASSLKTRAEHPERMSALKLPPSVHEQIIYEFLEFLHIPFEFRKLIGLYVVDFYLPELRLAIDCQGTNRFPLSYKRHEAITAQSCQIVYCVNNYIKCGDLSDLHQYITGLQVSGSDPSLRSKETVIWGARGSSPFGEDSHRFTIERLYVGSCYKLCLTATPND